MMAKQEYSSILVPEEGCSSEPPRPVRLRLTKPANRSPKPTSRQQGSRAGLFTVVIAGSDSPNSWDDWALESRCRKVTAENKELQLSLQKEYNAARKAPAKSTASRKKAIGSDLSSGRGSEDRSSAPVGRGTKRGRDMEIEKVSSKTSTMALPKPTAVSETKRISKRRKKVPKSPKSSRAAKKILLPTQVTDETIHHASHDCKDFDSCLPCGWVKVLPEDEDDWEPFYKLIPYYLDDLSALKRCEPTIPIGSSKNLDI